MADSLKLLLLRKVISTKSYLKLKALQKMKRRRSDALTVQRARELRLNGIISPKSYLKFRSLKLQSRRKPKPRKAPFNLFAFTDEEAMRKFRFKKEEIVTLTRLLQIPNVISLQNRIRVTGVAAMCILLRRLSYPNRLSDICSTFGKDPTAISRISNYMTRRIYNSHCHLLTRLRKPWLTPAKYAQLCDSIVQAGSPLRDIVGFIDGTIRGICRPSYRQREFYTGYKKCHVVKYQSVLLPNGIIGRLDGPFVGRRHDSAILHLSKLLEEIPGEFRRQDGSWMSLYGDPGYANQKYIKVGYKNQNHRPVTRLQKQFNADMSALRVSVEYGFGKILQQFAFLDFKKNQKFYKQPLKEQYYVAALLTNCQTCLRGNQVSEYFDCAPPTLEEYLN